MTSLAYIQSDLRAVPPRWTCARSTARGRAVRGHQRLGARWGATALFDAGEGSSVGDNDRSRPSRGARPRRNTRPRDALGRPLPYGSSGIGGKSSDVSRSARESLTEAWRLLDEGRPFEAHEVLEDAWKSRPEWERELWRGLAQIAVGITHAARGNAVGSVRLIERGASNISPYTAATAHGLNVAAVIRWSEQAIAEVARGTPIMLKPPPLLPPPDGR
jgi:uncharacterized protein